MNAKRLTPAAVLVLGALLFSASVAEAGWFGRARDAAQVLITEGNARRGWVIFEPVALDGGDLELLAISVLTHDPLAPAFLVRFQVTDAPKVMREIQLGNELTVRKFRLVESAGELPVYVVEPRRRNGWRSRPIARASPFFAQWSYLVAGRALASYPDQFDRFFGRRPDQLTLLRRDVQLVYDTVFGGDTFEDDVDPVALFAIPDGEGEVDACRLYVEHVEDRLARAAALLDQVLALSGHDHHGASHVHVDDAVAKARRALELIEEARAP